MSSSDPKRKSSSSKKSRSRSRSKSKKDGGSAAPAAPAVPRSWETHVSKSGEYQRPVSQMRNRVTKDGPFPPESGRYHLYVCHACPWAHRTLIMRALKGLEKVISVSVVHPLLTPKGWHFDPDLGYPDHVGGRSTLRQVYEETDPNYSSTITVPVLYDKKTRRIVNNESSEIIRILNTDFDQFATKNKGVDYYPEKLRSEIDELNEWIYHNINNGVYKAGFAVTQDAYEKAYNALFEHLDKLEALLAKDKRHFLTGKSLTEADVRLVTTLFRFDAIYVVHFKCNKRRIADYPHIQAYLERMYNVPGIAGTFRLDDAKYHYFASHTSINPKAVVPKGPELPWYKGDMVWHGRSAADYV